jgi:O-antigen ligase
MPLNRAYCVILAAVVIGYAFMNKSFAYVGYNPVFISEIMLALGLGVLFIGGVNLAFLRSPISLITMVFVTWCFLTAIPAFSLDPILAARDSVIWIYAAFALLVAGLLLRTRMITGFLTTYARVLPFFLAWVPIGFALGHFYGDQMPVMPGSTTSMLTLKGGDFGVHLAGAGAFLALGLHDWFNKPKRISPNLRDWLLWIALGAGLVAIGSQNRGGLLSVVLALAVVYAFRPRNRLRKLILPGILFFGIAVLVFSAGDYSGERKLSLGQFVTNFTSIFDREAVQQSTVNWRLAWWEKIVDYSFQGPYFWTGKGYALNLALADGFYTGDANRNPHNGHLTILARSGVPGFAIWLVLQAMIGWTLIRSILAADHAGLKGQANILIWALAYWLAFLTNTSFDVFLEGPQGGIPFWCLVGMIIAMTEFQRQQLSTDHAMHVHHGSSLRGT